MLASEIGGCQAVAFAQEIRKVSRGSTSPAFWRRSIRPSASSAMHLLHGSQDRRRVQARQIAIVLGHVRREVRGDRGTQGLFRACSGADLLVRPSAAGGRGPRPPASTTDSGPPWPCATANAIEFANAPLFRATLENPQRSGACGRGTSKPRMISSAASDVAYCPWRNRRSARRGCPSGPEIRTMAPSAIRQPGQSAAGSASATLPPMVPWLRMARYEILGSHLAESIRRTDRASSPSSISACVVEGSDADALRRFGDFLELLQSSDVDQQVGQTRSSNRASAAATGRPQSPSPDVPPEPIAQWPPRTSWA